MNKRTTQSIFCVAILLLPMFAWASGVFVTLSPAQQIVKSGEAPRFSVKVKAIGVPLRIMKFGTRRDLLDNYARMQVTEKGKQVDVPVYISDPGLTSEADYDVLAADQSVTFVHFGTPMALDELPPGDYSAMVRLKPDWRDTAVESNLVSFRVVRK